MRKKNHEGHPIRGEFLQIVDQIQIFLEKFKLQPYSSHDEARYMQRVQTEGHLPDNKYFWTYEIDESEGNKGSSDEFFGFLTIYIITSNGVRRDVRVIEVPSHNSFKVDDPANRYVYDIDFKWIETEISTISELTNRAYNSNPHR